ncbi:hypothetical protein D7B24_003706 [Verticillium nonalfalfae]|uniref:MOSC domain-containing protein n=1 Tax=Verticillium nonalfalfae TaxID=1051616 RepID=A0A3M9XZ92_9PEZI|nr:uncharacterized protein D7B24_003706 [Verticillium nonalfalfae]RNJ52408.1 hypothetical protein D7B24_003706 [Verticillium nonalfalfae]
MEAHRPSPSAGSTAGLSALLDFDATFFFLPLVTLLGFLLPIIYLFPPVPATKADALQQTHDRLGLGRAESNLRTHNRPAVAAVTPGASAKLQALTIYPVKSCRGIELTRSRVLPTGLEFDRLYTFAQLKSPFPVSSTANAAEKEDGHVWEFITQRQFARLANVKVDLYVPRGEDGSRADKDTGSWIVMRFPWRDLGIRGVLQTIAAKLVRGWYAEAEREFLLPVEFPTKAEIGQRGYEFEKVKIWKDVVTALNLGVDVPEELRSYLGVSNKLGLFRIDPLGLRQVFRCAPRKEEIGYQPTVGFQDAYPLHLMNLGSLQDFDSQVPKDGDLKYLDVRRFRSNLIVTGAPAYDEESWKSIRFTPGASTLTSDASFQVSCRTVRCKLPNVDPATGIRHRVEPDRSLRKIRDVDPGAPKMGCLGVQMCPLFEDAESCETEDLRSWLEVGMTIDIESRGEHVYIKQ